MANNQLIDPKKVVLGEEDQNQILNSAYNYKWKLAFIDL
jgi:hypothetical protein